MLREVLILLHIDITKNIQYDRLTRALFKDFIQAKFNCVDIGCHKGEILDLMLKYAPRGQHHAFEPIPHLYNDLKNRYSGKAHIYPYALADQSGESVFQLVKNAPAYSGLRRRRYDISNPEVEEIKVEVRSLDEVLSGKDQIHLIKIDVEGGEWGVLKGAKQLLSTQKPMVLFECGKGAFDYYGHTAQELYTYLTQDIGMHVYTLPDFMQKKTALSASDFMRCFEHQEEYYFVATS